MRNLLLLTAFLILTACGQRQIKTSGKTLQQLALFKAKEKFQVDSIRLHYPGLQYPQLRPVLSEKINKAAVDFETVARNGHPTAAQYQEKIKTGLQRFSDVYLELDTEDRERVCHYFEELMDIVHLESSDGLLNDFMYGFDPSEQ